MKKTATLFFILLLPALSFAQDARVLTFNHTLRLETESQFPNYFLVSQVRDSIYSDIRQALKVKLNVADVAFPEQVGYRIITLFGKPKNELSKASTSPDYDIDIFSCISKETYGFAVNWSVNIVIQKDGAVILSKVAAHEIENANIAGYLEEQRWMSPQQFKEILCGIAREAMETDTVYQGKIIIGSLEEREKEVRSWFPNSTRYLLKNNGAIQAGNFAACLVNANDTITQYEYKDKLKSKRPISLKPALSGLFTDLTGVGMDYSVVENQQLRRTIAFLNGPEIMIQMKWNQKVTASTVSDDVEVQPTESLTGQLFKDTLSIGNFTYERVSQVLSPGGTKEKITSLEEKDYKGSLGTAVIHRVKGTIHNKNFSAEYNQLFGISELKTDNETCAYLIFHNCNPANPNSFNRRKISANKRSITDGSYTRGDLSLASESRQEWYPIFIKENSTPEEIVTDLEILTCLFFGMGKM